MPLPLFVDACFRMAVVITRLQRGRHFYKRMPLLLVSLHQDQWRLHQIALGYLPKSNFQGVPLSLDIARITLNSISVVGYRVGRVWLDFEAGSERITRNQTIKLVNLIAG